MRIHFVGRILVEIMLEVRQDVVPVDCHEVVSIRSRLLMEVADGVDEFVHDRPEAGVVDEARFEVQDLAAADSSDLGEVPASRAPVLHKHKVLLNGSWHEAEASVLLKVSKTGQNQEPIFVVYM